MHIGHNLCCRTGGCSYRESQQRERFAKRIKEGSGKSKQDLKDAKARLSQAAADCDSAQKALTIVSKDYEKVKSVSTKLSQEMYNALVAQFKSVLDIRDWEHIDLIISILKREERTL